MKLLLASGKRKRRKRRQRRKHEMQQAEQTAMMRNDNRDMKTTAK